MRLRLDTGIRDVFSRVVSTRETFFADGLFFSKAVQNSLGLDVIDFGGFVIFPLLNFPFFQTGFFCLQRFSNSAARWLPFRRGFSALIFLSSASNHAFRA